MQKSLTHRCKISKIDPLKEEGISCLLPSNTSIISNKYIFHLTRKNKINPINFSWFNLSAPINDNHLDIFQHLKQFEDFIYHATNSFQYFVINSYSYFQQWWTSHFIPGNLVWHGLIYRRKKRKKPSWKVGIPSKLAISVTI